MKTQVINEIEPSILELEKAFQGIGKDVRHKKKYASEVHHNALNTLKDTKKLHRNWA